MCVEKAQVGRATTGEKGRGTLTPVRINTRKRRPFATHPARAAAAPALDAS